jgi:hypothetical protein
LARYAALQGGQQASLHDAPDLNRIKKLPAGLQRSAAPSIAAVQRALAARGLLTQPTQKVVWRDKKRKKHAEYRPAPFPGKPDKATVAALNAWQWRNGLRRTDGVLDAVTLGLLGLPPLGPEILMPPYGPQCEVHDATDVALMSELPQTRPAADYLTRVTRRVNRLAPGRLSDAPVLAAVPAAATTLPLPGPPPEGGGR